MANYVGKISLLNSERLLRKLQKYYGDIFAAPVQLCLVASHLTSTWMDELRVY